jgi:hypothetical protein
MSIFTISDKRSQSSRINGARSRGPVTPEGKSVSSRNAIRHGLLANTIVLSNEDEKLFEELFYMLVRRFDPVDDVELSMIEELAASCWRLRRAFAIEKSILESGIAAHPDKSPIEQLAAAVRDPMGKDDLWRNQRYETRLQNTYQRALRGFALLRKLRAENSVLPNEPETPNVCTIDAGPLVP